MLRSYHFPTFPLSHFPAFPLSHFSILHAYFLFFTFPLSNFPAFPLSHFPTLLRFLELFTFPLSHFPAFPLSRFPIVLVFLHFPTFPLSRFPAFPLSHFPLPQQNHLYNHLYTTQGALASNANSPILQQTIPRARLQRHLRAHCLSHPHFLAKRLVPRPSAYEIPKHQSAQICI